MRRGDVRHWPGRGPWGSRAVENVREPFGDDRDAVLEAGLGRIGRGELGVVEADGGALAPTLRSGCVRVRVCARVHFCAHLRVSVCVRACVCAERGRVFECLPSPAQPSPVPRAAPRPHPPAGGPGRSCVRPRGPADAPAASRAAPHDPGEPLRRAAAGARGPWGRTPARGVCMLGGGRCQHRLPPWVPPPSRPPAPAGACACRRTAPCAARTSCSGALRRCSRRTRSWCGTPAAAQQLPCAAHSALARVVPGGVNAPWRHDHASPTPHGTLPPNAPTRSACGFAPTLSNPHPPTHPPAACSGAPATASLNPPLAPLSPARPPARPPPAAARPPAHPRRHRRVHRRRDGQAADRAQRAARRARGPGHRAGPQAGGHPSAAAPGWVSDQAAPAGQLAGSCSELAASDAHRVEAGRVEGLQEWQTRWQHTAAVA